MARAALVIALAAALALGATTAGAGPHSATKHDEDAALDLFVKGREDLRAGHAAEALAELERSMALLASPNTLLLIGHAHRELGDRVKALADYDKTIALASAKIREGETRFQPTLADAEQQAATLRAALSQTTEAKASTEPKVDVGQAPPSGVRAPPALSLVAFGLGGVAAISFAIFGGMSLSEAHTLDACSPHCDPADPSLASARDAGKRDALIANVSLVTAGVAIASGVVLWVALPSRDPAAPHLAVGPRSIAFGGAF